MSTPTVKAELLLQDRVWVDATGKEHAVEDLPTGHLWRVVVYLQRCADALEAILAFGEAVSFEGTAEEEAAMWERLNQRGWEALPWLQSTPLMVRMKDLLIERGEESPW